MMWLNVGAKISPTRGLVKIPMTIILDPCDFLWLPPNKSLSFEQVVKATSGARQIKQLEFQPEFFILHSRRRACRESQWFR
jgi:hypothetical protein